ncbi:Uncharacterised protein [Enterobacter cloacae]|nr:Uncharacterised protein [Enterobacter cloacae]
MTDSVCKLFFLKAHQIFIAFQRSHQLITHLLDVLEMAKWNVALGDIGGAQLASAFHFVAE